MTTAPDKSDEQLAKEREAVQAMQNAKANMSSALSRIETLERGLKNAIFALGNAKNYIAPHCYGYPVSNGPKTCHSEIDASIASAQTILGPAA